MADDQAVKFEDLPAGLREVAELLAAGMTNQQIADKRVVTYGTVKQQVRRLRELSGTVNRVQLARWVWDAKNAGGNNGDSRKSDGGIEGNGVKAIGAGADKVPGDGDPAAGGSAV